MKIYIILLFIITNANNINAQQPLDTIYANDKMNVALFFPEPIRQGITGADHFVFTYNREKQQYFGLLQATPGQESNLLAVTKNGKVYSYILKYKDNLTRLNYFLTPSASIGNEGQTGEGEKQNIPLEIEKPIKNTNHNYEKFSNHLLESKFNSVKVKRKAGVKLQLQKIAYQDDKVYMVINIKNNSYIDFEVDYLGIYLVNGNKKRKASYQRLLMKPIYRHDMPTIIKANQSKQFVCVLPKFVVGDHQHLELELKELKGSRKVILKTRN